MCSDVIFSKRESSLVVSDSLKLCFVDSLIDRVESEEINEIIFALSATMEGDTTNYYIFRKINKDGIRFSTIARGVSIGDNLEYTDEITLGRSIIKRIPFEQSSS